MPDPLLITPAPTPLLETACDAMLVPLSQDGNLEGTAAAVNEALEGLVEDMRRRQEFRGEAYQLAVVPTFGRIPASRVALVGLGKLKEATANTCRLAVAAACRALGKRGLREVAASTAGWPVPPAEAALLLAEGAELSRYVPDPYRTGERRDTLIRELRVAGAGGEAAAALEAGAVRGRAKNLARELTNEPSNILDPPELARRAQEVAAATGLGYQVLDEAEMERLGMGAILAVTRGSGTPARFILLRHEPRKEGPLLALVGKAVTFDTGGISIKPSADMGRMKGDMAGGAAVLGAMQAIAQLQVPLNVVGLIPSVVNMPDGCAWKPGDVITAMSGKTIETITTDAEGRMLLADAVHYAGQVLKATHIVDIATLTGACAIALGHVASGLYGTDEALVQAVRECGEAAGER
ncbi:MAG TPA: M17 family peptidase N-terminal domain-containing protein, partial [Armatimonadota bacterium]|nr:M17 family peptidase N-terminal domain-containing protein [Armatimonadota bacterium]